MEELLTLLAPLMEFLSPMLAWSIGIVIAIMEAIKKFDKEKKFKRWYWVVGAVISALFGLGITFVMGFSITLFLFHFAIIYIAELGVDIGFLKPVIKELLPILKKVLVKSSTKKIS